MVDIFFSNGPQLLLAGFIYVITPGPGFAAILCLVPEQGRKAGFQFVSGMMAGSMAWLCFTCFSLINADKLPDFIFIALALACAFYLVYLGVMKIIQSVNLKRQSVIFKSPAREGMLLSFLNPKSYPVMMSVFGSVAVYDTELLEWRNFTEIFFLAVLGFILGYVFMVMVASIPGIMKFYKNHNRSVSIMFSLVFFYFAVMLILNAYKLT